MNKTSPCESNGITVYDGRNASAPSMGTFCDNSTKYFRSSGYEMYIEFKTDANSSAVKFEVNVTYYGKSIVKDIC